MADFACLAGLERKKKKKTKPTPQAHTNIHTHIHAHTYTHICRHTYGIGKVKADSGLGKVMTVLGSIIHKTKNQKQRQHLSMDEWVDETRYIHTVKFYLAIKQQQITDTCSMMDKLQKCYGKGKKPGTEQHILCDSIYTEEKSRKSKFIE